MLPSIVMATVNPPFIPRRAAQSGRRARQEIRQDFPTVRSAFHLRAQGRVPVSRRSDPRRWTASVTIDFMAFSSYGGGTTSSGEVRLIKDLDSSLEGRDVIIVEDIVDTGLTLHYLQEILRARSPKSLRTACLLSKPSRRKIDVKVDYIGFTIEDQLRRRLRTRLRRAISQPPVHRRPRVSPASPTAPLSLTRSAARRASRQHLRLIRACSTFPIAHQHLPVDDRRLDVVAARDVDDLRDRIEQRLSAAASIHPDDDQSASLPGFERSEPLLPGR